MQRFGWRVAAPGGRLREPFSGIRYGLSGSGTGAGLNLDLMLNTRTRDLTAETRDLKIVGG
jgi:hypothetical protein